MIKRHSKRQGGCALHLYASFCIFCVFFPQNGGKPMTPPPPPQEGARKLIFGIFGPPWEDPFSIFPDHRGGGGGPTPPPRPPPPPLKGNAGGRCDGRPSKALWGIQETKGLVLNTIWGLVPSGFRDGLHQNWAQPLGWLGWLA